MKFKESIYYTISIIAWAASIITPRVFGYFIDMLNLSYEISFVLGALTMFISLNLLQSLFVLLRAKIYSVISLKISHNIYCDIYSHILTLDRKKYININPYYFNESVTADSLEITNFVINNLFNLLMTTCTFAVGLIVLFWSFSFRAIVLILLLPIYYFLHYKSENYNNLFDLNGDMINDCFRGKKGYSIGQKQKINIIQALNKNADLIILDEPTSALDNESAEKLADVLLEIKKEKIIIFVSHDNRLLKICDKKIEL